MPGASPETMASSVAVPLERHLGQIADVTEMSSQSSLGNTRITLQFGLDRDIDGAARDVQAAINAARADLPSSLKQNPSYHKFNPADAPIMVLALTSTTRIHWVQGMEPKYVAACWISSSLIAFANAIMRLVLPLRGSALLRRSFLKSISVLTKYSTGMPATGAFSGRPFPFGMWHRLHAATFCACLPLATISGIGG